MLSFLSRLPLASIRVTATGLGVLAFTVFASPLGAHWN